MDGEGEGDGDGDRVRIAMEGEEMGGMRQEVGVVVLLFPGEVPAD